MDGPAKSGTCSEGGAQQSAPARSIFGRFDGHIFTQYHLRKPRQAKQWVRTIPTDFGFDPFIFERKTLNFECHNV